MSSTILLNSTLPLIFGEWIMLGISLVFIISLEAFIYNKYRKNIKRAFYEISLANIFSTIVGIPIANVLRFFTMKLLAPILPTKVFPNKNEYDWEIVSPGRPSHFHSREQYFIVLTLLLVNFIVTFYTEFLVLKYLNKTENKKVIKRQAFKINLYSYIIIAILILAYEIYAENTWRSR